MSICGFCEIDPKRNPIIYQTEFVLVVPSNPRLEPVPHHTLVMSRRHVSALSDLSPEELLQLIQTVARFQQAIKARLPGGGCDISQHDRPFMRETEAARAETAVPDHAHFHLYPRGYNDERFRQVLCHERFVTPSTRELIATLRLLAP